MIRGALPIDIQATFGGRAQSRQIAAAVIYVVLYVLLDWLSYVQPVLKLGLTPWNPQAGLTLAFMLLYGPRWAPAIALAVILSEVLVRTASAGFPLILEASTWVAVGYAALGAALRRRGLNEPIRTIAVAARLAGISVAATFVIAIGYAVLFIVAQDLPANHAIRSLPRLWIGDLTGILTVTPLLIYAPEWRRGLRVLQTHWAELLGQAAALAATFWAIFGLQSGAPLQFFYLLFVPVIWIALRWSLPGAMLAALIIQIGLLIAVQADSRSPSLVDLQFLMLTLSLTALLLGSVVSERAAVLRTIAIREAERRSAEAQLRERDSALARAMRFAVAGELASALAHELNQPITAVVSYLRAAEIVASTSGQQDGRLGATLAKAAREAIRASDVLRRLRDFYQAGALKRETIHFESICAAASSAFHDRLQRAHVTLMARVAPDVPSLQADAIQLEIVLHNLLSNAIDAVAQSSNAWRRIELNVERIEDDIVLRIEDTGSGLDPELAQKQFEPFVTSKPDGMGLGLAISRSFIRARGGDVSYQRSQQLGGACFTIRLPIQVPTGDENEPS